MDKIAVLADIHGNRWALEAVLEDLSRRQVADVLNLGDSLYGPLDPAGTADLLLQAGWPAVKGNQDRVILEQQQEPGRTLAFVRDALSDEHIAWLRSQPAELLWEDEFYLTHGSPGDDQRYFIEEVRNRKIMVRSLNDLTVEAGEIDAQVMLVGHSHLPRMVTLLDDTLVVNPGSVGLQAYWDDHPASHVVENHSPQARYAVLQRAGNTWQVEQISLKYDWDTASWTALRNKRPDWAYWLRTGVTS